jgi:hypothetical protein
MDLITELLTNIKKLKDSPIDMTSLYNKKERIEAEKVREDVLTAMDDEENESVLQSNDNMPQSNDNETAPISSGSRTTESITKPPVEDNDDIPEKPPKRMKKGDMLSFLKQKQTVNN